MSIFHKLPVLLAVFFVVAGAPQGVAFPVHHIQAELSKTLQSGLKPVAVFDLDETVVHTARRKIASYQTALQRGQAVFGTKYPRETQILLRATADKLAQAMMELPNQYDSKAWLGRMGIQNELFRMDLDQAMLPIYLSNEWMHLDRAFHGAQALLESFYRAGGEIYFVSSRYRTKQYDSTIQRLILSKLYRNSKQSHVILREDNEPSFDFKVRALQQIRQSTQNFYKVILVAENEPENLNAMMAAFPLATPVYVVGAVLNTAVSVTPSSRLIRTKTYLAGALDLR